MKSTTIICVLTIFLVAFGTASLVSAWELRLNGALEYKYEYYSQLGKNGFFGPYDISNSAYGFPYDARSNGWLGIETFNGLFQNKHPGIVSGSDASRQVLKMELAGVM